MTALLPCPFCGSEAEFGEISTKEETLDAGGQFIQCTSARCAASSALIFPCGDEPKPLLAERWNQRADFKRGAAAMSESKTTDEAAVIIANLIRVMPNSGAMLCVKDGIQWLNRFAKPDLYLAANVRDLMDRQKS